MKTLARAISTSLTAFLFLGASAFAENSVTLTDVHLCCNSCVTGVTKAISSVNATSVADQDNETVVLTAVDKSTLQQAVNALVAAGYFGKSSDAEIKMVNDSGAKDAKVEGTDINGVHLCCGKCVTTVNEVLGQVPGVSGTDAKKGATTFKIKGDFNQKAAVDALLAAGLAGKVWTK
jgi:periplasmic mercuric ion binding protein